MIMISILKMRFSIELKTYYNLLNQSLYLRLISILISCFLTVSLLSCSKQAKEKVSIATEFDNACSSCHMLPSPENISKDFWKHNVLPEMAARMGLQIAGYKPLSGNSMEENIYIKMSNVYPEKPIIDSAKFKRIFDYIIALAPDNIPLDSLRNQRNSPLSMFKAQPIALLKEGPTMLTAIQFDTLAQNFSLADIGGNLTKWPEKDALPLKFRSPIISDLQIKNTRFITEIGYMNPSEKPQGVLHKLTDKGLDTLIAKLHRPVYTKIYDLDGDGNDEILICEFGHHTGELSLLELQNGRYVKKTLLAVPGTIKLELADMNKDGKQDIVVLASQGNEGVFILYQQEGLNFFAQQPIRMGPEYGSSWFELIDYNKDGALDIVLVNGDNADYSIFFKPYHGLRIFLNDQNNAFSESWFYPIYGATRVLSEDFDLDGDLDFAVMSFFSESAKTPDESFVFLENINSETFKFKPYALKTNYNSKWLVMDKGDHDQDGDIDLLLGAFVIPNRGNLQNKEGANKRLDLLLLENKTK